MRESLAELLKAAQDAESILPDLTAKRDEAVRAFNNAELEALNTWNAFAKVLKAQNGLVKRTDLFAHERKLQEVAG